MNPERWRRIEQLYHAALEQNRSERADFLQQACGDDTRLLCEVELLVAGHEDAGSFMDAPAWERAGRTFDPAPARSLVGRRLGRYQLLSVLGRGGTGTVYLAEDTRLERHVALKLLPSEFFEEPQHVRRFEQEVRAISALSHPNIVAVHDTGETEQGRFIVMELAAGRTFRVLASERLQPAVLVHLIRQVAQALAAAHSAGIVHRDIKPENLIARDDGYAKVLDFGLARLMRADASNAGATTAMRTDSGMLLGTMHYMSPEQVRGEAAASPTDIFSLGTVFYELVTGQHPFAADSQFGVLHRILSHAPPSPVRLNPEISEPLGALILGMVEKDADRRPTAAEVASALDRVSTEGPPLLAIRPRLSSGGPASDQAEANRYFENAMQLKVSYDVSRCRAMLARALELDRHFAEARAWYGFTTWLTLDAGYSNDGTLLYEAERDMRGALHDDPTLARAHAFLAAIYFTQGRRELMPAEVHRALCVNSADEDALHWLLHYHHYNGDYAAAQVIAAKVLTRLPLFFPTRMILGDMLRQQGDLMGAVRELNKILEQDPRNAYAIRFLARTHIDAGNLDEARRILDGVRPQDRESYWTRLVRAILLAREGDTSAALTEVDSEVLKWSSVVAHIASDTAVFYSVVGDVPAALGWLDRAIRQGDERGEYFARDPLLANVREDPRFAQMLEYPERSLAPARGSRMTGGPAPGPF